VAVVPGEAFGVPGRLRLSYALAPERMREGMARLKTLLGESRG
jgi:aspartate/methionine/tyrosine aminotransferase